MLKVTLGRTGLAVNKNGFGALPLQRVPLGEAVYLLQKALDNGIDYYDTARAYSDSEEKLGAALASRRDEIIISTKTGATTAAGLEADLAESLRRLRTDYIDLYQLHNPDFCPRPGDGSGLYEALLSAQAAGKIRHIGITNHRLAVAQAAVESGLYATLQFPFSYLASPADLALVEATRAAEMGFIAMKALSGGLITHAAAAYAYMAQFAGVEPIWGIQRDWELDEFLAFQAAAPELSAELREMIEADRASLAGAFCRGCGYCLPCPAGIEINNCARMSQLIRRAPAAGFLTPAWQAKMALIETCQACGQCRSRCPYGLNTPELLKANYADYLTFV